MLEVSRPNSTKAFMSLKYQVIPGNPPGRVLTNFSLLWCKTLRPLSVTICRMTDCSHLFKSKVMSSFALRRAQYASVSVLGPSKGEFQVLKLLSNAQTSQ